ncbi:MAG: hypothetical protein U1F27_12380 [Turneriella sp.]
MIMDTIASSRANMSALLRQVQEGETVMILDRGVPVARFEPVTDWSGEGYGLMARALTKSGDMLPRKVALGDDFFDLPLSEDKKAGVRSALLEERREGR